MDNLTNPSAYQGETLCATFRDASATAVSVTLKDGTSSAVIAAEDAGGGVWRWTAPADAVAEFEGRVNWLAMANRPDGAYVIASGSIYIRPLVSKWREVVDAIDDAIKGWGTNANQTVTVGEISITAKTLQDLVAAREHFAAKARAAEAGRASVGGPRVITTRFRRY